MARGRWIKSEFWTNDQVTELSMQARLAFIGLLNFCDDAGTHLASEKQLRLEIFPDDGLTNDDIAGYVWEMMNVGLVCWFEADGHRYWHIPTFIKHQRPHKPSYKHPRVDAETTLNSLAPPGRPVGGKGVPPYSPVPTPTPTPTTKGTTKKDPTDPMSADEPPTTVAAPDPVVEVFEHWKRAMGRNGATRLDVKRRRLITVALNSYGLPTVRNAITGYTFSPHHMGQNERNTRYDSLELILRDPQHIEAGLEFLANPPKPLNNAPPTKLDALRDKNRTNLEIAIAQHEAGEGTHAKLGV